jgi:succinoglycan biosynthesis transport protein ExoP
MLPESQKLIKRAQPEITLATPVHVDRFTTPNRQLSVVDMWRVLIRRKLPILAVTVAVICLAAVYVYLKTPVYESVARVQIDPTRSANMGLEDADKPSSSPDTDSRIKTEIAIIESNTVALQVIKSLGLYSSPVFAGKSEAAAHFQDISQVTPSQRQELLDKFSNSLSVKLLPNTQIVEIRFRSTDPDIATNATNSVIDEYMLRNFHVRVDGTAQASDWLSKEMEDIRANTTVAQQKLADFEKANNFLGADESDNIVTDRLKQLNEELTQAEADRIVKEGRYRLARSGNPELIASVVPGTTLQILRSQEADLKAQYAQMNSKFGSGYPKLRELQSQVTRLESAINTEEGNVQTRLGNDYGAAAKTETMIRDDFDKQKNQAYKLNESVAQYAILKHEVESGQQLYDTLRLKVKEAGVASGLASSYVSVVDRAQIPDSPVEPRKGFDLALGLGGGLFGGLMLGLVLDSFDDTVRTSEELEAITGLPELSSVPFLAALSRTQMKGLRPLNIMASGSAPISAREPNSSCGEAYRSLCSVVLLSSFDKPPQVLVVTSALPGEGKSTVSCNLAVSLARGGKRVLLVDADLRCSSIDRQLGIGKEPGLSNMFAKGSAEWPRSQPIATLPNLHVVPAGFRPAGPVEILSSPKMQEIMAAWRDDYDHIIVDTPPMLAFADALVLAARADGVILVARSGVSRSKALSRARELLSRSGANVLGFVLNAVRRPEYYQDYPDSYKELVDNYENASTASN